MLTLCDVMLTVRIRPSSLKAEIQTSAKSFGRTVRCVWCANTVATAPPSGRRSVRSQGKLGIGPAETLRKRARQAEVETGSRPSVTSEETAEIRRLKRENAELKRANEILIAASYLATELDRSHTLVTFIDEQKARWSRIRWTRRHTHDPRTTRADRRLLKHALRSGEHAPGTKRSLS
jgi:transposase